MAGFGFASIGHFFASAFHDIHVGALKVEQVAPQIAAVGGALAPEVEALSGLLPGQVGTKSQLIERAAFQALGDVAAAVSKAAAATDAAGGASGLSVSLDADAVASYKSLFATFKDDLAAAGIKV